jgi:hypothetical protein
MHGFGLCVYQTTQEALTELKPQVPYFRELGRYKALDRLDCCNHVQTHGNTAEVSQCHWLDTQPKSSDLGFLGIRCSHGGCYVECVYGKGKIFHLLGLLCGVEPRSVGCPGGPPLIIQL